MLLSSGYTLKIHPEMMFNQILYWASYGPIKLTHEVNHQSPQRHLQAKDAVSLWLLNQGVNVLRLVTPNIVLCKKINK